MASSRELIRKAANIENILRSNYNILTEREREDIDKVLGETINKIDKAIGRFS